MDKKIYKNYKIHKNYRKLDTKQRENELYRIVKLRDKKSNNLNCVRYTKSGSHKILVKHEEIK